MRNMDVLRVVLFTCFGAVAVGAAGGCQTEAPNPGDSGGRIDPYRTTRSDRESEFLSIPDLMAFGDEAAAGLAKDLADIDQIQDRDTRAVLELGTIVNKTNTPTQDFEQMQKRLRNAIRKSRLIRDQFKIVESGQRMDVEKVRTQGEGPEDLLQEGPGQTGTDRYDADDTYVLQGDFYEARRGDVSRAYLNFQLTHVKSREIVFNKDYEASRRIQ